MDDVIVSSIEGTPQDVMADSQEEWLIVEDAIQAHISATDPMLDSDLMGANIRERTLHSKMMTAAGSTTVNADGCELLRPRWILSQQWLILVQPLLANHEESLPKLCPNFGGFIMKQLHIL